MQYAVLEKVDLCHILSCLGFSIDSCKRKYWSVNPELTLRGITLSGGPMTPVQDHANMSHTITVPLTHTDAGNTV